MWHAQAMANRRMRNVVGADEITHAIHWMLDAMQPVTSQPRAMIPPTWSATMEDSIRHRPTKFTCKSTLDEADVWLRECEKICRVIDYTDAQRLIFVTFVLVADVDY